MSVIKENENFMPVDEQVNFRAFSAKSKISAAKFLSRWFQVDIVIKMFGDVIFEWHFPPQEEVNSVLPEDNKIV